MIERAQRGRFAAPRTRVAAPSRVGEVVARGLGQLAQTSGNIAAQNRAEADRRVREKEAADDNAAFINAEIQYAERMAEVRTELQNEVGPDGDGYARQLRERSAAVQNEILAGLPSYVTEDGRGRTSLRLQQLTGADRIQAAEWQDQRAQEYAVSTYERSVNAAATTVTANPGNAEAVLRTQRTYLDGLSARLPAETREAMWRATEQQMLSASIDGLNQRGDFARARELLTATSGVTSAEEQRAFNARIDQAEAQADQARYESLVLGIQQGTVDSERLSELHSSGQIDDGAMAALSDQVERQRQNEIAQQQAAYAQQQAETFAMIQVGVSDGNMGRADIDRAYQAGRISTSQWSQLARQANNRESVRTDASNFLERLQSGIPFDPTDPAMERGADEVFRQGNGPQMLSEDFAQGLSQVQAFASSGVIPPSAVSVIRGMAYSQDDASQQRAYSGIYELHTNYDNVTRRTFSSNEVADAMSYGRRIEAGMSPEMALAQVRMEQDARAEPGGAAQVRQREAAEILRDVEFSTAVGATGGFLGFGRASADRVVGGADAALAIRQNYERSFTSYYMTHGDEDLAREQAQEAVARAVGRSEVNRDRYMMHPPEMYYPSASPEDMRQQVQTEVSLAYGEVLDPEKITLVSDTVTARNVSNGEQPSYAVMIDREDGVTDVIPGRFVFDAEALQSAAEERAATRREQERVRAAQGRIGRAETSVDAVTNIGHPAVRFLGDEQREGLRNIQEQATQRAERERGQFRASN